MRAELQYQQRRVNQRDIGEQRTQRDVEGLLPQVPKSPLDFTAKTGQVRNDNPNVRHRIVLQQNPRPTGYRTDLRFRVREFFENIRADSNLAGAARTGFPQRSEKDRPAAA